MTGINLRFLLHRQMDVGHGLGFYSLGSIDNEEGALAGGKGAGHFVGEVDVARECRSG